MKLKKYTASTEELALELVTDELGKDALILNVKKTQPRGIRAIFQKEQFEVTAAYEDTFIPMENITPTKETKEIAETKPENEGLSFLEQIGRHNDTIIADNKDEDEDSYSIEKKIQDDLYFSRDAIFSRKEIGVTTNEESLLKTISQSSKREVFETDELIKNSHYYNDKPNVLSNRLKNSQYQEKRYKNKYLQMIYQTLVNQGVEQWIANNLLKEVETVNDSVEISQIIKIVYNKILKILGEPKTIDLSYSSRGNPKIVTFLGPTGVGKTTTIAKLSSHFILNEQVEVGLLTSDTYRIAAIEQLKTYAEILNIDIKVVYDNLELVDNLIFMGRMNDLIMIDTAGRSHKNVPMMEDLKNLLDYIENSENYLVLSLTTKSSDLIDIINSYKGFVDFSIVFTKLDETNNLGSILNICHQTGKRVSYLTNGQSVPDDIEPMSPEKIAKSLLGLGGEK